MDSAHQSIATTALVMKFITYFWMMLITVTTVAAAKPVSYSVTFSAYALQALKTTNLYYADAHNSLTKLEFRKKSRSNHYQATIQSDDGTLRIYRQSGTSAEKKPPTLVERIRIEPSKVPLLLLITVDNVRTQDAINVYVMDDSQHNFPLGSIRLVNITGIDVYGKISTALITLQHGGISQAYNQASPQPIDVSIAAKGNSRNHLLYKNHIQITSGSRGLLILTPPAREGSIRIGGHLLLDSSNEIEESSNQL
jgi:hypothetical protein